MNKLKFPVYLKYNLHKDGSVIWQGCKNETELHHYKEELTNQGYKPVIDHLFKHF